MKRASWQTKTWTSAHLAKPEVASTVGHGWKLQEGVLIPVFFEGPTALDKLQDFFCGCMGIARCSRDSNCPCRRDGVACSEVCRCEGDIRTFLQIMKIVLLMDNIEFDSDQWKYVHIYDINIKYERV